MNIREYQVEASRTCSDLGEKLNLAHMVLGICSEEEELYRAFVKNDLVNIQEEQADKFWYLANYCNFRNYNLQELYEDMSNFEQEDWETETSVEIVHLSKLQDYVKKYIAYDKPIDRQQEKNSLKAIIWSICETLYEQEIELETILERNIAKLKARFSDKFTQEAALNRNLELERKILEGNDSN